MCRNYLFKVLYKTYNSKLNVYAVERNHVTGKTEFLVYFDPSGKWQWIPGDACVPYDNCFCD